MPFTYGPKEAVFGYYPEFPEWKRPSVYRRDVPLPPAVGPLWFREEIQAPPQAFAPFLYDLRVDHDDLIPLIPDITSGGGLALSVSGPCRFWKGCFRAAVISGR